VHRRLLIRPGAIGDFIVSLPAMECLRSDYLEVWSLDRNLPLVRFADAVLSYVGAGLELAGVGEPPPSLWRRLESFDSIVSWYGANRAEFRQALGHLPAHFFPALPPPEWRRHAADFYLEHARQLAICHDDVPRIHCAATREDFIAVQPFSGSLRKNWPLDRFQELARRLPLPVRWCAGPEEPLDAAVRIENLYDLACWLASGRLYIGNDSGISHLAAAAGTPVVALFGPTDPAVWAPRGTHVFALHAPGGDMRLLEVDTVEKAVRDMLSSQCV
jgi:ADP-heptose:LPS heptosyltransferase